MATVTHEPEVSRIIPLEFRHRVTIEEYHKMAELGIYPDGAPIELLEGVLVDKMGKNPPHILSTELIESLLHKLVPDGFFVSMGNPVSIRESDSEPEPDAMVIRGAIRDYTGRHRDPRDAALVIEVSESTYRMDRRHKWLIYGEAGVPIFWIVDLIKNRLLVFTDPTGLSPEPGYRIETIYGPDDEVPIVLDGREVARIIVRDILP